MERIELRKSVTNGDKCVQVHLGNGYLTFAVFSAAIKKLDPNNGIRGRIVMRDVCFRLEVVEKCRQRVDCSNLYVASDAEFN